MSHNTARLGASTQGRGGDLAAGVSDLDDMTISSLTPNDILTYASGTLDWRNGQPVTTVANPEYAYLWHSAPSSYSVGADSYSLAGTYTDFWWRNGSKAPRIGSGVSPVAAGGSWSYGVTVPAGTYLLMTQPISKASAAENITWQWHDGTSFFGPKSYHQPSTAKGGAVSCAVYVATGSTSLKLKVQAVTGSPGFADPNAPATDILAGIHITRLL